YRPFARRMFGHRVLQDLIDFLPGEIRRIAPGGRRILRHTGRGRLAGTGLAHRTAGLRLKQFAASPAMADVQITESYHRTTPAQLRLPGHPAPPASPYS